MKLFSQNARGWTLIELLVLIAILAILAALIPCAPASARKRAQRTQCFSNLKQIALANLNFAQDHDGRFPFACPTNEGGSLEWTNSAQVFRHFAVLSNELGQSARVLTCAADRERIAAANFASLKNANLSYFICLDGATNAPDVLLAGDRNISGGKQLNETVMLVGRNSTLTWTKPVHPGGGNVVLANATALPLSNPQLAQQVALMTNGQVRLAIP